MASTSAARIAAPSGVFSLRRFMAAAISAGSVSPSISSAVKMSANSRADRFARVTMRLATGARSAV
ncbi:Uncharacterised protein [Mycobacteroides abscessus subsp. abscessus]|nr:Uncharacterised protein [Mycobacteroides abscessus subsp. abscessus]